mgnify:CR=1 FL=1
MKKISVMGNVTADAVVRSTGGKNVINFTVAENERYTDKQGVKHETVTFFNCSIWRDNTSLAPYIKRGIKVLVEGKPSAESYVNKEGKAMAIIKINVRDFEFAGTTKNENSAPAPGKAQPAESSSALPPFPDENPLVPTPDDDLPF